MTALSPEELLMLGVANLRLAWRCRALPAAAQFHLNTVDRAIRAFDERTSRPVPPAPRREVRPAPRSSLIDRLMAIRFGPDLYP